MLNLNERLHISQIVNNVTMKSEVSLQLSPPLDTILSQFYKTPMLPSFAYVLDPYFILYFNQQSAPIKLQ